jgi:DNA polymerase III delta prime subunit
VTFSNPDRAAIVFRLGEICKAEGINYTVETLETLVKTTYPDIRRAINILQASIENGKFNVELAKTSDTVLNSAWILFKRGDIRTMRELLGKYPPNWPDLYDLLYEQLFDDDSVDVSDAKRADAVRTIATWAYQNGFAANKELNFIGCVYETLSILGW